MMRNKPLTLFFIILALLFLYSIYDFIQTHERKEITEYTSFKGEAKDNPLYAARLFLKEMGIPTENKNDMQSIGDTYPDTDTVIILDTTRSTLTDNRVSQLLTWVEEGGHLITPVSVDYSIIDVIRSENEDADETDNATTDKNENEEKKTTINNKNDEVYCLEEDTECFYSDDRLQEHLNITVTRYNYIDQDDDDIEDNDDVYERGEDENSNALSFWLNVENFRVFSTQLGNAPRELSLATNPSFYSITSNDKNQYEMLINGRTFLLQRKYGEGLITLVSQPDIFENQLLREADNAQIFWYLIHSHHKEPTAVWLMHNDKMPNLLAIMWKFGWPVILSLAGLLGFWLLQSVQRFGPIIPKQEIARRRLMEHIEASGLFFWKRNNKQLLIESTRHALNQRMSQLHPAWNNTDEMGRIEHLAEMLDTPANHIKHLLFNNKIQRDEDFTQLVVELESIRRKL